MTTLRQDHDVLLLDLDGTVYQGKRSIVGAVEALGRGMERQFFVTNNASRSPSDVAVHLRELGFETSEDFVVTSAQVAARMLADRVEPGSSVVVVGTAALEAEITQVGLVPVRTADASVRAVVQGHNVATDWSSLAEATFAIRGGALWVATNVDATLPTERGLAPGNGSMVAAVRWATGVEPLVAGKPAAPIMHDAIRLSSAERPLVVGDRLDTDIGGANAAGVPSLLVLTGVSTALEVIRAVPSERPTHIGFDLEALNRPPAESAVGPKPGWSVRVEHGVLTVTHDGSSGVDALDGILAAAHAVWGSPSEATTNWDTISIVGDGVDSLRARLAA